MLLARDMTMSRLEPSQSRLEPACGFLMDRGEAAYEAKPNAPYETPCSDQYLQSPFRSTCTFWDRKTKVGFRNNLWMRNVLRFSPRGRCSLVGVDLSYALTKVPHLYFSMCLQSSACTRRYNCFAHREPERNRFLCTQLANTIVCTKKDEIGV